jgi:hypothetical protein
MSIIESLPNKSAKMQETYQKMAYFKTIKSYNDFKFNKAKTFFNKSLIYTQNKKIKRQQSVGSCTSFRTS